MCSIKKVGDHYLKHLLFDMWHSVIAATFTKVTTKVTYISVIIIKFV